MSSTYFKRVVWSVGALAIALALWFALGEALAPPLDGGADVGFDVVATDKSTSAPLEAITPTEGVGERAALVAEPAAVLLDTDEPACVLTGSVVDERGVPIAGLTCTLGCHHVWAAESGAAALTWGEPWVGFTTTTASDGTFTFTTKVPTALVQKLVIDGEPFVERHESWFGIDGNAGRIGLGEGVCDLGELVLAATGTVCGRVVDAHGSAVTGATVEVRSVARPGIGQRATTSRDGTYTIEHARVGSASVFASHERFAQSGEVWIDVAARTDTGGVDFTLGEASTISGVVRDEHGNPLAGVRVIGSPAASGQTRETLSDDAGRFTLHLSTAVAHRLLARLEGYERIDDRKLDGPTVAPDTNDVVLVLQSLPAQRLLVVDATTQAPIELFEVRVLFDRHAPDAYRFDPGARRPTVSEHPEGRVIVHAQPGRDVVFVAAFGYVGAEIELEVAPNDEHEQVVALTRSGTLLGRALQGGVPVADARVELSPGEFVEPPRVPTDGSGGLEGIGYIGFEPPGPGPGKWFRADRRKATHARTDADGRFAVEVPHADSLQLSIDVGPGASIVRYPLRVNPRAHTDLGDLHSEASGRIEGTLLVSPGVDPSGIVVNLDAFDDGRSTRVDASGHFVFDDVEPGRHLVAHGSRRGVLASGAGKLVKIDAGEVEAVELDARDRTLGTALLVFEFDGLAPAGRLVTLNSTAALMVRQFTLDPSGRMRAELPARSRVWASVTTDAGWLNLLDQPFEVEPLTESTHVLLAAFGTLDLLWPAGLDLPEGINVDLHLRSDDGARGQGIRFTLVDGAVVGKESRAISAIDGGVRVSGVGAGVFTLAATLTDPDAPAGEHQLPDGTKYIGPPRLYSSSQSVVITTSEPAVLQLR